MNLRKFSKQKFDQYQKLNIVSSGFLGRDDGVVRIPGKRHYVYVRLWNGEVIEAFNNSLPATPGLPVQVSFRNGRYYVEIKDVYDQPVWHGLPDGAADELQWPGSQTLYIRPEQFTPGLVYPKSGMTLYIMGGRLPLPTGGYVTIPPQEVDMTPYRPTTDAQWAVIELRNDGTVGILTGGSQPSRGALLESEIPSGGGYALAAVKMYNGQQTIAMGKYGSDIVDLRFFKNGGGISAETDPVFLASEAANFAAGDKAKLDGIQAGAQVNNLSDADALDLTDGGETALHTHDHGALNGLADDDHPQYHNDARGDARYLQLSIMSGAQAAELVGGSITALHSHAGGATTPGGIFQRRLTADLSLTDGECLIAARYIDTNGYDINMPVGGDCEISII